LLPLPPGLVVVDEDVAAHDRDEKARIGIVPSEAPPSNAAGKEGALYVEDGGPGPAGDAYAFIPEEACGFVHRMVIGR
jgi:hypothetical protein